MDAQLMRKVVIWGTVTVVVLFVLVATLSVEPNKSLANSAAVLAVITAAAIGIERFIEGIWTVIGQVKNAWWPFNLMSAQVDGLVGDLDKQLTGVYGKANQAIAALTSAGDWTADQAQAVLGDLDLAKQRIDEIKKLASTNQRVTLLAASSYQAVAMLEAKIPNFSKNVDIANQAVAGLTDFVGSFRENPGRRLISIYFGALLGLVVAGLVGLDMFQAVFGGQPGTGLFNTGFCKYVGVALTGLIIGLGSNPTHDVIGVLQEIKKSRAAGNEVGPEDQGVAGGRGAVVTGAARGFARAAEQFAPETPVASTRPQLRRFR